MKSRNTLSSFIRYCVNHPQERFWQALRNWSDYNFILASDIAPVDLTAPCYVEGDTRDTFYLEGRRHDEKSKPSS